MLIEWKTGDVQHQRNIEPDEAQARLDELDAKVDACPLDSENAAREAGAIRAMLNAKVTVDTTDFWSTHGREPRGAGAWAFCDVNPSENPAYLDHCIWISGAYVAARKAAIEIARRRKINKLYVCA